ncbi:Caskin-2 [Gossypium arboreum]|uniref:Caskin-2 n=1 Tax=Gossypium arboreum TaxID=29729 RepID=A0A0B0MRJ3_GOSAR|nr:Caskin-2 [Gossypium arboreum]
MSISCACLEITFPKDFNVLVIFNYSLLHPKTISIRIFSPSSFQIYCSMDHHFPHQTGREYFHEELSLRLLKHPSGPELLNLRPIWNFSCRRLHQTVLALSKDMVAIFFSETAPRTSIVGGHFLIT